MKKEVDIALVLLISELRRQINSYDFADIVWKRNGKTITFSNDIIEDHKFSGLNNMDFISVNYKE